MIRTTIKLLPPLLPIYYCILLDEMVDGLDVGAVWMIKEIEGRGEEKKA